MSRARAEMIEDTRARLIASARQAFATQGYANTSMDDFTARAGLTRGALYHHFGDKKRPHSNDIRLVLLIQVFKLNRELLFDHLMT